MNAAIETDLGVAIGAEVSAATPTTTIRVFGADDAAGLVDEEVSFPVVVVAATPAVPHQNDDVLHTADVRVLIATHYTQDRKATALAALLPVVRDALADADAINERMADNVVLLGLEPADESATFKVIQPGQLSEFPNLQGYELSYTAFLAACATTTTTTTTTAP